MFAAHAEQDQKNFDKLEVTLAELTKSIQELKVQAAKDRGFIAGISFVVGGIVALVSTFGGGVITWLRG
jgi:hypothetical protein